MNAVDIVALCTAILLLLVLVLAINVSLARGREKVPMGGTGSDAFLRAQRAHGNSAEHTPVLVLLLMGLATAGAPDIALGIAGATAIVARTSHALGLLGKKSALSVLGTYLTYIDGVLMGLGLVAIIVLRQR